MTGSRPPEILAFTFRTRHSAAASYDWESNDKYFSVHIHEFCVNDDVQLDVVARPECGHAIEVHTRATDLDDAKRKALAIMGHLRPLFTIAFPGGTLP